MTDLLSFEVSANNPNHAYARFNHADGFTLAFDINAPRGLDAEARADFFSAEISRLYDVVENYDVEAGKARADYWINAIAEDRRRGYSAD